MRKDFSKQCKFVYTDTIFRINPTNACRVVIDVSSYSTVEDDRSVYKKGKHLDWWVDAEEYSIIDMEKDVFKHFSWANYQEANF
jgi:hypothetical protein